MQFLSKKLSFITSILFTSLSVTSFIVSSEKETFFTAPLQISSDIISIPEKPKNLSKIAKTRKTIILFLEDAQGKRFLLKTLRSTEYAIHETLGAKIRETLGVNANKVKIFPPQDPSITSIPQNDFKGVTTLHTHVPGQSCWDMGINIEDGLSNQEALKSIAQYKKLCEIVASDIATDDDDRNNNNILFDDKTNHFYVIDMEYTFNNFNDHRRRNRVADYTLLFLKELNSKKLSYKEVKALKRVNNKLQDFQTVYPPEKIYNEWMNIAKEAEYVYDQREHNNIHTFLENNAHQITKIQNQLTHLTTESNLASDVQIRQKFKKYPFWYNTTKRIVRNPYFEESFWQL